MAMDAFDLAERFQTLVFVMSDLDLGMNTWMAAPFKYPEGPIDRGKVLDEETLGRLGQWGRYNAAWALGQIGDKRAVEPLIKASETEDVFMKRRTTEADLIPAL